MKSFIKCLCLVFLLPLTTDAKLNGEIVFLDRLNQLWITPVNHTDNARLFYQRERRETIWELSVQKNGHLIAFFANIDESKPIYNSAVYLINTNEVPLKPHRLTPDIFNDLLDIDMSQNGDIIFTNTFRRNDPPVKDGIYLIPNHELNKASPEITMLKETDARRIDWSPNGKQIAYDTTDGVYLFYLETEKSIKVHHGGRYPAFSPKGGKIAFAHYGLGEDNPHEIRVISVLTPGPRRTFRLKEHLSFFDLKWSPDGEYIVYSVYVDKRYRHFAIPFNGGPHEEILSVDFGNDKINNVLRFDWAPSAYVVESINQLTTVWGKLKTDSLK